MVTKFSGKFAIIMLKRHRKFCMCGLTHLDATPTSKDRPITYAPPCSSNSNGQINVSVSETKGLNTYLTLASIPKPGFSHAVLDILFFLSCEVVSIFFNTLKTESS